MAFTASGASGALPTSGSVGSRSAGIRCTIRRSKAPADPDIQARRS